MCYYPGLWWRGSGTDGFEDGAEWIGAGQAGGVDNGADGGLALGRPHGAVAVGDLPLHDGRTQQPLRAIVRRLDLSGIGEEDQELIARAADLDLQVAGQVTAARRGEDGAELPILAAALG